MSHLSRSNIVETLCWLAFAAAAYVFSFEFDRDIEIYEFGAVGWPRAVILLIVFAALCQCFQAWRGFDQSANAATIQSEKQSVKDKLRVLLLIGTPIVYASLLDISGFYFTTPFFIFFYLMLNGERRILWLIGVTLFIYCFIVLVFTKLLYVGLPIGYAHPFYDFSNWLLVLIR